MLELPEGSVWPVPWAEIQKPSFGILSPPLAGPWACDVSLLGPLSSLWKASGPVRFCGDIIEDNQFFPVTLGTDPGAGRAEFQGS